jgi:(E)-4-hydroxy-3-methylbut-2-enyl-diphosphate synthase
MQAPLIVCVLFFQLLYAGVAIAVMGCIVNGPGEMADADFGYVGGAPGKIDLYVGKEVVRRGIPMDTVRFV